MKMEDVKKMDKKQAFIKLEELKRSLFEMELAKQTTGNFKTSDKGVAKQTVARILTHFSKLN